MKTASAIALATLLSGLLLGAGASAQVGADGGGSYQTARFKFTEERPGKPSGYLFDIDYVNPDDPDAKPPAVRRVVTTLARGARYDTSVPALCTASDAELIVLGPSACPPGSVVAEGFISLDTGLPDPARFLEEDVTFLNNSGELIFLTVDRLTGVRFVVRATVEGRRTVSEAPFLPGTPPDGTAIDTVHAETFVTTRRLRGERRSYVTTPPRCPRRGYWINRIDFTYDGGVEQTVESRSPCERSRR